MTVPQKIALLVAERGWNQDHFAELAGIDRMTAHRILTRPEQRLRNQTLQKCAAALGLGPSDLLTQPIEKLLARPVRRKPASKPSPPLVLADQPLLQTWLDEHPERAAELTQADLEELLSLQGTGGPLTLEGVEYFVNLIERKRMLRGRMEAIAGTEYLELLEQIVELLYERIRPYRDRV